MSKVNYYHPSGIIPIEVWQGEIDKLTLFEHQKKNINCMQQVVRFAEDLYYGVAKSKSKQDMVNYDHAKEFSTLVLSGGGLLRDALGNLSLSQLPFQIKFFDCIYHLTENGSQKIAAKNNWSNWILIDVGQYQLKISTIQYRMQYKRSLTKIPNVNSQPIGDINLLLEFLKESLDQFTKKNMIKFKGIILALPVAIDINGNASPCSYPGLFGNIKEKLKSYFSVDCIYLNDTTLAAYGLNENQKSLLLTIGYGVGGAVCIPS